MSLFSLSETNSCCLERIKTEPLDDTNDFPAESKNQPDMGVDPLAVVKHESSDPTSDDNNASQLSGMPRRLRRKTTKGQYDPENMKQACELVLKGRTIRYVCKLFNVNRETVRRKVNALKDNKKVTFSPVYNHRQVFNQNQEEQIAHYLKLSCAMFYGLTPTDCRKLAYQTAKVNGMRYPSSWSQEEKAGDDWLRSFLQRNRLSLRSPEGRSLSRASAFNRANVEVFFDNFMKLVDKHPSLCDPSRIFNLDETSVVENGKALTPTGIRAQYQGRGTLVTTCCIIRADGNVLPPVMVFPCVNYNPCMIKGAPANTLGLAHSSGWMNSELFVETLAHFIKYSCSTPENPSLLIYDDHESHMNIQVYDLAQANGVHILTIPPHSTHKMQPLDVGVYSLFQTHYTNAIKSRMIRNPAQNLSIYEVAAFVGEAFLKSFTPLNIMNAFKKTGIYPTYPDIFQDSDG
uniref:DDE-1 domain-containing protein n=1 Tax=Cacopsylla melanoneura TaxID=428564 RepID=A0A8D8YUN3_9HEMI